MTKNKYHPPVLKKEVLKYLHFENQASQRKLIDTTLGNAGHTLEFLKKDWSVLGLEFDWRAFMKARVRLDMYLRKIGKKDKSHTLVNANFVRIAEIAKAKNFQEVGAILFDLGLNESQQTSLIRGFSFANPEAAFDMRLNPDRQGVKAADLLNSLSESQLKDLFSAVLRTGETIRLCKEIVKFRKRGNFEKVGDFLKVCSRVFKKPSKTHPATRAFLAVRMAVNSELQNLEDALTQGINLLSAKGRIGVITFHSGEDGLVKNKFRNWEKEKMGMQVTKKPVLPSRDETSRNSKARSAKLRIFEKF